MTPNTDAQLSTATRVVCIAFLSLVFFLSAVFMLFGIAMEGMRHSVPGPDQFDHYYFDCCIPAGFFGFMLLVSLRRLPSLAVIFGSAFVGIASLVWLAYGLHKDSSLYTLSSISAVIMLLAAFAAWRLHTSKPHNHYAMRRLTKLQ